MEWLDKASLLCTFGDLILEPRVVRVVFPRSDHNHTFVDILEPANFSKAEINRQLDVKRGLGRADLDRSGQNPDPEAPRNSTKPSEFSWFVRVFAHHLGSLPP